LFGHDVAFGSVVALDKLMTSSHNSNGHPISFYGQFNLKAFPINHKLYLTLTTAVKLIKAAPKVVRIGRLIAN
jgi:hypothetical protein